jgi:thiol-disulfide isomerase/thioredoxin
MRTFLLVLALAALACRSRDKEPESSPPAPPPTHEPARADAVSPKAADAPQVSDLARWNYPAIAWTTSEAGLTSMKSRSRPGIVVLQGDWCGHCRAYSGLFRSPAIQELMTHFEPILVDSDSPEADAFRKTGSYVPRTLFLRPDGSVDATLVAPHPRFPHFFSVKDEQELILTMKTAASRYSEPGASL